MSNSDDEVMIVPEPLAAAILVRAIQTGEAGLLLGRLFAGWSVTLDNAGELAWVDGDMLSQMMT